MQRVYFLKKGLSKWRVAVDVMLYSSTTLVRAATTCHFDLKGLTQRGSAKTPDGFFQRSPQFKLMKGRSDEGIST